MAIDKNNPLEQQNTPERDGSSGSNSDASTYRRKKPRRDGKGSNTQTNSSTKTKSSNSKARRSGKGDVKDSQALTTQTLDTTIAIDPNLAVGDAADDAAAYAEGGIKAIGNQRIIPFMKIEKPMAILSILLVIGSIIAIAINGLNLGLDFTGGVSADVRYEQSVEQTDVVKALADNGFNDAVVQYLGTSQELLIRLPPQSDNVDGLNASLSEALKLPNNNAEISNVNIIGSQVGNEIYLSSVMAIVLALACMLGYVALRFQFKLAIGAVLSLFHDAIVTIGVFALFGFPFDLTVLAAILALIGYSLNDTIVVYDRIRENFRRVRGITARQTIDLSVLGSSLTLPGIAGIVLTIGMAVDANVLIFERIREELANGVRPKSAIVAGFDRAYSSIFDANITTLLVAFILFAIGTGPIKGFAITLAIGIMSSLFTAILVTRALIQIAYGKRKSIKRLSIG